VCLHVCTCVCEHADVCECLQVCVQSIQFNFNSIFNSIQFQFNDLLLASFTLQMIRRYKWVCVCVCVCVCACMHAFYCLCQFLFFAAAKCFYGERLNGALVHGCSEKQWINWMEVWLCVYCLRLFILFTRVLLKRITLVSVSSKHFTCTLTLLAMLPG
jgi:hypothetical protein